MNHYYLSRNGETLGPFSEDEIRLGLANGTYSMQDLVCQEGWNQWEPAVKIFGATPPPLPAVAPPPIIAPQLPQVDISIPDRDKAQKIKSTAEKLLTKEEFIVAVAAQSFSPMAADGVVLTNRRVLLIKPQLGGLKMSFNDYLWADVGNIHIEEEILGTKLSVQCARGYCTVERLDKEEARALYRIAQQMEELARLGRHHVHLQTLEAGAAIFRR